MSDLTGMTPIVYQDVMRVIIAGPLGKPSVGVGRANSTESPLRMTVDEARELAQALIWAIQEYDGRMGKESFYPSRYPRHYQRRDEKAGD